MGKVYLQTAIDCHSRHAWGRLYANKLPMTAVPLLNNDVLPTFDEHGTKVVAVLSDNGREFCGREDQHPYELFLQLEEIEHRRTRVKRPQSNGIVERLHRTLLDEPIHGTAPDIAGQGIANPSAMILSLALLYDYSLGLREEAGMITAAIERVLADGLRTADLAGPGETAVSTAAFGDAVVAALGRA